MFTVFVFILLLYRKYSAGVNTIFRIYNIVSADENAINHMVVYSISCPIILKIRTLHARDTAVLAPY